MPQSSSSDAPEFDRLVVESTDPGTAPAGVGRRRSRGLFLAVGVAGAVIAAAVVASIVSIVESSPDRAIERSPSTSAVTAPVESLAPVVTALPFDATVIDVSDRAPSMSRDEGIDGWTDWSLPASEWMDGFDVPSAATEVVAMTADGVLHRIELPTGTVRSRSVPDVSTNGQIALAGDAVAVPLSSSVAVVADDGSVTTAVAGTTEVPRVVTIGSLDRFLVTGGRTEVGAPERQWVVEAAGAVTEVADGPFAAADPVVRHFLPSGELLVRANSGVDAVDVDGAVRRLDDGEIVATGRNHYAIRLCDPGCGYTVVETATCERRAATLPVFDRYRFYDTATRLSPDGRFVQIADWRREQPEVLLVSVADGAVLNRWVTRSIRTADVWAADSSGAFGTADGELAFYSVDGRVTVIDGLGPVRSVAARPLD